MTRETIIETYLINSPKAVAEMLYDTITRYETALKQGQENYDKLWDMYSELKKENKKMEKYELMDTVMEQFDPREMASYIYANDKEFALQLLDFLGQEEMMEEDPRCR